MAQLSLRFRLGRWLALSLLIGGLCLPAAAGAAAQTAKLRIFFQPLSASAPPRAGWKVPAAEFVRLQYAATERFLAQKGFYEVIPETEVRRVLREEAPLMWRWQRGDWALAKEVGRQLEADYAMIAERGFDKGRYWRMALINLETGRTFDVQDFIPPGVGSLEDFKEMARAAYRKIFDEAKGDMLATALRKGRAMPAASRPPETSGEPGRLPAAPQGPIVTAAPSVPAAPGRKPEVSRPPSSGRGSGTEKPSPGAEGGKMRLIVHDFEAGADLQAAGMILAEALREELLRGGRFILINREDMVRALEEHKLKMVGLVEEEGSAEMGRFLMAQEMITGKLTRLGGTSILQTKRTDIESLGVRNLRSLKSPFGREEELLDGLPELARRLYETP